MSVVSCLPAVLDFGRRASCPSENINNGRSWYPLRDLYISDSGKEKFALYLSTYDPYFRFQLYGGFFSYLLSCQLHKGQDIFCPGSTCIHNIICMFR